MKIKSNDFRVHPGAVVKLKQWPTRVKPVCKSKKRYQQLLQAHVAELSSLQQLHYASNRHALLLIFQGMDAAGKDGAIQHVMSGVNAHRQRRHHRQCLGGKRRRPDDVYRQVGHMERRHEALENWQGTNPFLAKSVYRWRAFQPDARFVSWEN